MTFLFLFLPKFDPAILAELTDEFIVEPSVVENILLYGTEACPAVMSRHKHSLDFVVTRVYKNFGNGL